MEDEDIESDEGSTSNVDKIKNMSPEEKELFVSQMGEFYEKLAEEFNFDPRYKELMVKGSEAFARSYMNDPEAWEKPPSDKESR